MAAINSNTRRAVPQPFAGARAARSSIRDADRLRSVDEGPLPAPSARDPISNKFQRKLEKQHNQDVSSLLPPSPPFPPPLPHHHTITYLQGGCDF